ncbi:uncharacterized protein PAC_13111 [Phialocephala subalpina]|uniref:1-alkyl-2-acetylglycerophosphocholine esterase n=1 Tax=Phialocephala subalpina TaxID=576137 RepID=A0A1L7XDV6_9HELO|nr:uncharacterized protein PAC_13111 [Phialocephala subalpina]
MSSSSSLAYWWRFQDIRNDHACQFSTKSKSFLPPKARPLLRLPRDRRKRIAIGETSAQCHVDAARCSDFVNNSQLTRHTLHSLQVLTRPYSVGTISLEAINSSRLDPCAPTPQPRALMISLFYPTTDTKHPLAPYLPSNLASFADRSFSFPPGFLEQLQTQSHENARLKEIDNIPIILFSHASYGYLVVAIDHTYDVAAAVEFPYGSLVLGLPIKGDALSLSTRVTDTRFIIDTTLQAMESDSRILGGATLDGPFSGSQLTTNTHNPFLLFGRENHTRFNDPEWEGVWKHLKGWKAELTLANSTHPTFSNEAAVFELLGVGDLIDPGGVVYGSIDGVTANAVLVEYLRAFFNMVLKGGGDGMFEKAGPKSPEVSIV